MVKPKVASEEVGDKKKKKRVRDEFKNS